MSMSYLKESDGEDNRLICSCCGEIIDEDDSYYELEDGSIICDSCFDDQYGICDSCGKVELSDELTYWGDSLLCRSCLSDALPDLEYDQEENEEETTEAFEEMKSRYLGKKTWDLETGPNLLSYVDDSYDTPSKGTDYLGR